MQRTTQRRPGCDLSGHLERPTHEPLPREHLRDQAHVESLAGIDLLPGEHEVAGRVDPHQQREQDMDAITRDQTTDSEMGGVLERGLVRAENYVVEQGQLRVTVHRPVDRRDDRNLDVEQVHYEPPALPHRRIPLAGRGRLGEMDVGVGNLGSQKGLTRPVRTTTRF